MRDFFTRQRENLFTNIVASGLFTALAALVTWASSLPSVAVPAWLFVAVAAFLTAWWWFTRPNAKLRPVVNESFGVEQVHVDGKHFADCTFKGSELVFRGTQNFSLKGCHFSPLQLKFEGPAGIVLTQLRALNGDPGFSKFVHQAIQSSEGIDLKPSPVG